MNLEEINNQIKEYENSYREGELDLATTTKVIEETLKEYIGEDRIIPIKEYVMPVSDESNSFVSGIEKLDSVIGKFKKGDIFTITAGTGVGKSSFARELYIRFSEQNKKCLFFSYEDSNEGLKQKLGEDIPDAYIPNVLNDRSLVWIEARILESIVKYGVEIVFIDNLKAITDFQARNVNNSIEFTMQKLKEIAMKYKIMIFLCAHIKKEEGKTIDINSIKDSSSVADTSSLVIAMRRKEESQQDEDILEKRMTNLTIFSIIKNRNNGKQESFKMIFRPKGIFGGGRYDENITGGNIISQEDIKKAMQ